MKNSRIRNRVLDQATRNPIRSGSRKIFAGVFKEYIEKIKRIQTDLTSTISVVMQKHQSRCLIELQVNSFFSFTPMPNFSCRLIRR